MIALMDVILGILDVSAAGLERVTSWIATRRNKMAFRKIARQSAGETKAESTSQT